MPVEKGGQGERRDEAAKQEVLLGIGPLLDGERDERREQVDAQNRIEEPIDALDFAEVETLEVRNRPERVGDGLGGVELAWEQAIE